MKSPKIKSSSQPSLYRVFIGFGLINGLGALLNTIEFLRAPASTLSVILFKYCAWFSGMMLAALVGAGMACLVLLVIRSRRAAAIFAVIILSFLQIYLFVDVRVHAHLNFHINRLVISAMLTPGYWDSLHLNTTDLLLALSAIAGIVLAECLILWGIMRNLNRGGWIKKFTQTRVLIGAFSLIVLALAYEKAAFAFSDFSAYTPITRYRNVFPFYQPVTGKRFVSRLTGKKPVEAGIKVSLEGSLLDYPAEEYRFHQFKNPLNILVILVESMRFDMLVPKTMPNLFNFSKQAIRLTNHYSGGNTSRFGGFSLLYGLYSTYWHSMLAEHKGPIILSHLDSNNYQIKAFSSTSFDYPEFSKTIFADFPNSYNDRMDADLARDRDRLLVNEFISWLDLISSQQPFFCFAFLDSPHSPYSFFKQDAPFKPYCDEIKFVDADLRQDREAIFNRYRNAIHCVDGYIGEMIEAAEKRGLLENTIILITGDHGQEFWEKGNYGHNSSYTDYQTKVPLVLYIPGENPGEITWQTNHYDLSPTILNILGNENPPQLFSNGKDVFDPKRPEFMVLAGWSDCCLFTPKNKMRFALGAYRALGENDLTRQDEPASAKDLKKDKNLYLIPALKGMGQFLK